MWNRVELSRRQLLMGAAAGIVPGRRTRTIKTRASYLPGPAAGLGTLMHMADYLESYQGSRTSILAYVTLDGEVVDTVVDYLHAQARIQDHIGHDFWPQIPLQTHDLSLTAFVRDLAIPESRVAQNVRTLARAISRYRERNKWFFIRPFCEMNDATAAATWELGNHRFHNAPADLATAWQRLRTAFDMEGATNAIFVFSPLAAYGVHREAEILETLNQIPAGRIDAFGLNVYSRPMTAYGGTSIRPIPFKELVEPWFQLLERSQHRGIPTGIAEMAVSSQASDELRAEWVRNAFLFARSRGCVLVAYFNYPHRYWQIDEDTQAGKALKQGINSF